MLSIIQINNLGKYFMSNSVLCKTDAKMKTSASATDSYDYAPVVEKKAQIIEFRWKLSVRCMNTIHVCDLVCMTCWQWTNQAIYPRKSFGSVG